MKRDVSAMSSTDGSQLWGVENIVVAPEAWCGAAKTDKRDARELCLRLERYHAGNTRAFSVVRVPTEEQEKRRSAGRQRERLLKERIRAERRGASMLLLAGIKTSKGWWQPASWARLSVGLAEDLCSQVNLWQQQALHYETIGAGCREPARGPRHDDMEIAQRRDPDVEAV
jgi:hypothetical protein